MRSDFARELARDFVADERGATSVIYGICFTAVFFIGAMAIDYGLGSNEKLRQQSAIDAATLAASHKLGTQDQDTAGPDAARAYYNANVRERDRGTLEGVAMDADNGIVTATGRSSFLTSLLNGIGISSIEIATGSKVAKGTNTVEIALVLDNSGSMSGELANLKTSTKNLLSIVFAGAQGTERVRVGLIPFAASVNVGAGHRGTAWLDNTGLSPIHHQNFSSQTSSRFALFDEVGVTWGGCVEARPAPHDTTDTAATAGTPSTLFVPMFAPDEPDIENDAGKTYNNNWLVDDAGACTPQPQTCTGGYTRRGNCRGWTKNALAPDVAQARTCKYIGQSKQGASGPNLNCTTAAVLPLTSTRSSVETAVDGMVASGWTNISEGIMWGWRVLSPGAPFDEGREFGETGNRKVMIVMTDGENTYQTQDNHNKSMYGAFGYATAGRLGSTPSAMPSQMDGKLAAACSNAKAAGVTVYTIAFRDAAVSSNIRNLLRNCASDTDKAFVATDAAGLNAAFQDIGREVAELRVAG